MMYCRHLWPRDTASTGVACPRNLQTISVTYLSSGSDMGSIQFRNWNWWAIPIPIPELELLVWKNNFELELELKFLELELELKFATKNLNPQISYAILFGNSEIFLPWQSHSDKLPVSKYFHSDFNLTISLVNFVHIYCNHSSYA